MTINAPHFSELLNRAINEGWGNNNTRSWSIRKLASSLGVSRSTVRRWREGSSLPQEADLVRAISNLTLSPAQRSALIEALTRTTMELTRRKLFKSATVAVLVAHDLLSHGFKTALCKESPDSWHEKVTQYGADYMRLGAATLRDRLSSDLIVLQRQVGNAELWDVTAKLMTLFGKTIPGNEGLQALEWYQMAAEASDRSDSLETRIWVRGRAAIAFGYEGAALVEAKRFADEALQLGERRSKPTLGELNAVMGRAHVAALEGDYRHAKVLKSVVKGSLIRSAQQNRRAISQSQNGVWLCTLLFCLRGSVIVEIAYERRRRQGKTCPNPYQDLQRT